MQGYRTKCGAKGILVPLGFLLTWQHFLATAPELWHEGWGRLLFQHYYATFDQSPEQVHKFYKAIKAKILSLNCGDFTFEIKHIDAQVSLNGSISILVIGYLTGKDNAMKSFAQSFFLAPQYKGKRYGWKNNMHVVTNLCTIGALKSQQKFRAVYEGVRGRDPLPPQNKKSNQGRKRVKLDDLWNHFLTGLSLLLLSLLPAVNTT
ncbi:nuclear transport factor 2 [Tanacetum coccineum]